MNAALHYQLMINVSLQSNRWHMSARSIRRRMLAEYLSFIFAIDCFTHGDFLSQSDGADI
jgi:hypothetical protein